MLPTFISQAFKAARGGVMTVRQLRAIGVPGRWVLALEQEGAVERLLYGCYVDPTQDALPDRDLHLALAYLSQRRPADRPAELVSGMASIAARCQPDIAYPGRVLVLTEQARRPRKSRKEFLVVRTDLAGVPHEVVRRARVAPVPRSLEDAAGIERVGDARLRDAVYALKHRRQIDVVQALAEWRSRTTSGARRLVALTEAGEFEHESHAEREVFLALFDTYPPAPDCQVQLAPNIRVDFVFLSAGLVLEYHGSEWHDGSVDADATRAWALTAMGYVVIVITKSMMRDPAAVAAGIHRIRVEREQLIASGALRLPPLPVQPPRVLPLRTLHVA